MYAFAVYLGVAKYHNKKETKRVGERIRQLRIKRHLNVEDIAAMTGFSRTTIANIEKGGETNTSHLIEIAKAIGVSPDQFFTIPFDLKPRYKVSQKRKDLNKATYKVRSLVENGFFREARFVEDVRKQLQAVYNLKTGASQVSVILLRLAGDGVLSSSKKGRKNIYISK